MNIDTEKTRTQSALILSGILLLIVKSEYYWKQIVGLVPLVVKIAILLLALAVGIMIVVSVSRIYQERISLYARMFFPVGIYVFSILASFADPFHLSAESLQSRIVLKGHYTAITNSATIIFRNNGRVEFEGNGFLGYTYFYAGSWTQQGDTLATLFAKDDPIPWGSHLILYKDRQMLLPFDSVALLQQFPGFLLDDEQSDPQYIPQEKKAT
jgi:hypothetical protein